MTSAFPQEAIPFGAPHSGSQTSREAAEKITPHMHHLERVVLDYLISCGPKGSTNDETARALKMLPDTVRPRVRWLVMHNFVYDSGMTRKVELTGRRATVWVVS